MQQTGGVRALREGTLGLARELGLTEGVYAEMLDYTVELFESQGLGTDYYGYHNVIHELEVTYAALLAMRGHGGDAFSQDDIRHMYAAALLHDFEPQKDADKPHEEGVLRFIDSDRKVGELVKRAGLSLDSIRALILRTTYPFEGENRTRVEGEIAVCHERAGLDAGARIHSLWMGWFLSVLDRVCGYALGPFPKAMEMAKMNAHALGWHPYLIVRRSVSYFERLLNDETEMTRVVLGALPRDMRKCFMGNVLEFLELRRNEIRIQADYLYENVRLHPLIEGHRARSDPAFARELLEIYEELPRPLQFARHTFAETLGDPEFFLNTLRLGSKDGEIVGFAKGGPLERYQLRPEIHDENRGSGNTVFLEPIALKMGYWGMGGGRGMRNMFAMQAHSKGFRYMTSFALRDVVQARIDGGEVVEFVTRFDPERWDYYRAEI